MERKLLSPKKKLVDGCNPGNQSPGKYCRHSSLQESQTSIVSIVCLVVHDELVVHKVETVWSCLVRVRHHLANWRRRGKEGQKERDIKKQIKMWITVWRYECNRTRTNRLELTELVWKLRELVNVFTRVAAVGDAKAKVKVKVLEEASLEVMPLDHTETVNRPVAHSELHTEVYKHKQDRQKKSQFNRTKNSWTWRRIWGDWT